MNGTTPSNLYQFRNRFYNSRFQRFMSADPIGYAGGQINLYTYVANDPMNWTDPLGLSGTFGLGPASTGGLGLELALETTPSATPSSNATPWNPGLPFETMPEEPTTPGYPKPQNIPRSQQP